MLFRRVRGFNAFALTGRMYPPLPTQGVALGYWLIGLSGRTMTNPKLEFFYKKQHFTTYHNFFFTATPWGEKQHFTTFNHGFAMMDKKLLSTAKPITTALCQYSYLLRWRGLNTKNHWLS